MPLELFNSIYESFHNRSVDAFARHGLLSRNIFRKFISNITVIREFENRT